MSSPAPTHRLLARLNAGTASSPELEQALGLSQSSVARILRSLQDGRLVRIGKTRGARYGLRREVTANGSSWPLRRIDREGRVHEAGTFYALAADQYFFEPSAATLAHGFAWESVTDGLPYFLQDQRPAGFLGRAVPLCYPELNLPQRVTDWSNDHYLRYLTARGSDTVGDLILGNGAFDDYLARVPARAVLAADERAQRFPRLVEQAMEGGLPGSSAHGQHPKFTAILRDEHGTRHVLVKFSPRVETAVGQRWSDLLIAEHLAHQLLRAADVPAATSRIFRLGGRTYLEVDRFDRHGLDGRLGVTSLFAIDTCFYGELDNWIASAARLHRDGRIDSDALERIRFIAAFGELIANSDRHFGNLAFYDRYDGRFEPAPVYDMLPMLFAPEHDQIVLREFQPAGPTSDSLRTWAPARGLAERYWRTLAGDARISEEFRRISAACSGALEALPRTGIYLGAA